MQRDVVLSILLSTVTIVDSSTLIMMPMFVSVLDSQNNNGIFTLLTAVI
jgi:hypothetical protein